MSGFAERFMQIGEERGRQEGRQEEGSLILLHLLTLKFGPPSDRSVVAAQDALRDSKSPQRPRDETTFWPAFAPHSLRRLRHSSAFATALREWLYGVRDALCISPSRLRACAPSALRVYARAHTYAGLPASRFALPWPAADDVDPVNRKRWRCDGISRDQEYARPVAGAFGCSIKAT